MTGRVRVEPIGVTFELRPGETLMAAAQRRGYWWPTICKGNAQCNRCAVRVVDGAGLLPAGEVELAGLRAVLWRGHDRAPALNRRASTDRQAAALPPAAGPPARRELRDAKYAGGGLAGDRRAQAPFARADG